MEKQTASTADAKAFSAPNSAAPSSSQSRSQSKPSKPKSKLSSKPSAAESSHPQVPELFLDVMPCLRRHAQIFDEPEAKTSSAKPSSAKRASELTVERGEGELYDHDKKMSRLLKFQSTIQRCPSQVLR